MATRRQFETVETLDSKGSAVAVSDASGIIAELYRRHASELIRYVSGRFGSGPPEPEEVIQAAFAKLAASPDIGKITNPRSYLFTTACNFVTDYHRRANFRDAVHRDMAMSADIDSLSDFSPERVLLGKERLNVMEAALAQMPPIRRRMFLLARVDGRTPGELARQFGISESAVHKHVTRALADIGAAFKRWDRRSGGKP